MEWTFPAVTPFTRLTKWFSNKVEDDGHAVRVYFVYHNLCHVHKAQCVTPVLEAGLTDHA